MRTMMAAGRLQWPAEQKQDDDIQLLIDTCRLARIVLLRKIEDDPSDTEASYIIQRIDQAVKIVNSNREGN